MQKTYKQFVLDLGARESGADGYRAKNQFGFLGRYQFGLARLSDFGLCARKAGIQGSSNRDFDWLPPYSEAAFLAAPELQDRCFDVHVARHARWVRQRYQSQLGKTLCGVVVTLSGAVACCHLVGPGGLMYFMQNHDTHDANGTKASEYVGKFGGYTIPDSLPVDVVAPAPPAPAA